VIGAGAAAVSRKTVNCVPDVPPRAALIQVSPPDAAGMVTVTGQPGAVLPGSLVLLFTMETGNFADAVAQDDGSFTGSGLFAPPGTSILVKAAQVNIAQTRARPRYPLEAQECFPGTVIRAAEPPAVPSGVAVAGAGTTQGNEAPGPPAWTFQGSLPSQRFQPGDVLRLSGTLRIRSAALREAGAITVRASLVLERLSGADGTGSLGHNTLASVLLTPTGLPIERAITAPRIPWPPNLPPQAPDQFFSLPKTNETTAESAVNLSYTLPSDLPLGFYRPVIALFFVGVPKEPIGPNWPTLNRPLRNPEGSPLLLPVIQVGNPAPPRLFWTMLTDDLSNGTRGTVAIEDRGRFGVASRVLTQSETFNVEPGAAYRLEPFAPTIGISSDNSFPSIPLLPFRFPSGRLTVRVQPPDGSVAVIGPAPFVQARMRPFSPGPQGAGIQQTYQLSTLDPRFEVAFTQPGLHVITVDGTVEDIWGNTWNGGGTYHVWVARQLALDTSVLPGTPFEIGDVFTPGLTVSPPVPADVEVRFLLLPNSDLQRRIERVVRGKANRFGYFHIAGGGIALDQAGEYRVDVTASYRDRDGRLWMGSRTWGGVVATRNPAIIAHGKRGIDQTPEQGRPQWFLRAQTGHPDPRDGRHVHLAFHSGDIMWLQKSDSLIPIVTFQDLGGTLSNLLRNRRPTSSSSGYAVGELPLVPTRPDGQDPHLDPARVDLWAYSYAAVERPLVRVREEILGGDVPSPYWRFDEPYGLQIGIGQVGDLPNDIKFQYAAAVLRGSALTRPEYGVYGSLFVLVPDDDPGGGTRVFPPFQGNGGGPSGGPIMKLKGQDIDLFIHLTGVRPGTVLEVGDNFSIAGAVGPLLPAMVSTKVTTPGGRTLQFSGRANRVGYYYRPQDDFAVTEPGIYTIDVRVTFDGRTSAGQVTAPIPTGDVLGSPNGRFFVYVVPRDSPLLTVNLPETMTVTAPGQLDIAARAPTGQNLTSGHVTTMMPGFLLETNQLTASAGALSYRYDPARLARDFPNLDLNPPADVITISLFGQTTNAQGQPSYAARVLVLHGQEFFNLTPARAVANVSAASFSGTTLASESIVAAFGAGLATTTQSAATLPLPTSLDGTTINVKDSAGAERLAPLFFVSPAQANYQMPPGTLSGTATVTITNRYGEVSAGTVRIASVAPGLFAANANGQGVAAAVALRIKADGTQSFEPVARFDAATNRFVPALIDLGPETDQVFLILFGTGVRFNSGLSATTVNIGGVSSEVLFAGAAPGFVGLDQANVRLPRSLIGRGEVEIRLSADGQQANVVTVNVK
jgi:uncharacterized protein (TIGR03437 family)